MIVKIFSPFYWRKNLGHNQTYLWNQYVPLMLENYKHKPLISPDWNVHTSYDVEHLLKNRIDWSLCLPIYSKYINQFLEEYFKKQLRWEHSGIWYTAYGPGQTANTHEHIPDMFSFVHFIKFNPNIHWPISFINPQGATTKYMLGMYPELKDKIDFNNSNQSLFHPRFTPKIEQGDIVIFPAHLEHLVEKTDSNDIRITIAFNFKIK